MSGGTRSYEMARRLVDKGCSVSLITSSRNGATEQIISYEAGIKVYWIPVPYNNEMNFFSRLFAFSSFAIKSSWLALRLEADVVFASSTPLTVAIPGLLTKLFKRVPLVFEVRDLWPAVPIAMGILKNPFLIWLSKTLEKLVYTYSDQIVALAPGMRDEIAAINGSKNKISVIQNGCDLSVFETEERVAGDFLRAKYPWLSDRKIVLYTGTFGLANGVEYAVDLAGSMAVLNSDVIFVLIGAGARKKQIEEYAKARGVLDKNLYLLEPVPKLQVAEWLAISDFTLGLFSGPRILWKDAVQNKFFDSLAAGKPMACNFEGYQSRVAVENEVGIILNPIDVSEAAKELSNKLGDADWMSQARTNAMELASGEFNRDKLANKLHRIFESVHMS